MTWVTDINGICYLGFGVGAENYDKDEGEFTVTYSKGGRAFKTLVGAYLFYLELEDSAVIWDMGRNQLVERKTKLI